MSDHDGNTSPQSGSHNRLLSPTVKAHIEAAVAMQEQSWMATIDDSTKAWAKEYSSQVNSFTRAIEAKYNESLQKKDLQHQS